jgi:hypothetical protein
MASAAEPLFSASFFPDHDAFRMTALITIVWTIAGLIVGMFGLGFVGELAGIRAMEGQLAVFAITFGSPVGAVAGFALGLMLAKRTVERPGARRLLLLGPIAVLGLAVLGVYLFETWRTYDHLTTRPNTWDLGFQVRLPAGQPTPAGQAIGVELRSPKEDLKCKVYDYPHGLGQEGGHFIVSGGCPLFYATPHRTILVRIGEKPTLIFKLRVKARLEAASYSDWFPVDEIYDNATGQKRAPRPDEQYAIRYGAR